MEKLKILEEIIETIICINNCLYEKTLKKKYILLLIYQMIIRKKELQKSYII